MWCRKQRKREAIQWRRDGPRRRNGGGKRLITSPGLRWEDTSLSWQHISPNLANWLFSAIVVVYKHLWALNDHAAFCWKLTPMSPLYFMPIDSILVDVIKHVLLPFISRCVSRAGLDKESNCNLKMSHLVDIKHCKYYHWTCSIAATKRILLPYRNRKLHYASMD